MDKYKKETFLIGSGLIGLSLILHFFHYLIFKDLHHTLIFLVADIAFVPMDVFFTAFVIEKLLDKRETHHKMEKLIIIKGVFYSELGNSLLDEFVKGDKNIDLIKNDAFIKKSWGKEEFKALEKELDEYSYEVNLENLDIKKISDILNKEKDFLISLITNPTLMEHESFSDMIITLMHLREELLDRYFKMECECNCCDKNHIEEDIEDAYRALTYGWVRYMRHLKKEYPKLFLKAMLNNPFDDRSFSEKYKVSEKNGINICEMIK